MKISHSLVPPDGFKFIQGKYTIEGDTFDELLQNVRHHRISNLIPFGDLESEIEDQLAERFPHLVLQRGN